MSSVKYKEVDKSISKQIMSQVDTWEEVCQSCNGSGLKKSILQAATTICRNCLGEGVIEYKNPNYIFEGILKVDLQKVS